MFFQKRKKKVYASYSNHGVICLALPLTTFSQNNIITESWIINFQMICRGHTGCPRMFYTVFQENIKIIKSIVSLIIMLVIESLISALTTVEISFTYLYPLRCDMVSLKIDE